MPRELNKYKEFFPRFCFLPFSVETLDSWGAIFFITLLGKKISSMKNDNKSILCISYPKNKFGNSTG
jgi:hypothetical protein